jgi:hypothetical protein
MTRFTGTSTLIFDDMAIANQQAISQHQHPSLVAATGMLYMTAKEKRSYLGMQQTSDDLKNIYLVAHQKLRARSHPFNLGDAVPGFLH